MGVNVSTIVFMGPAAVSNNFSWLPTLFLRNPSISLNNVLLVENANTRNNMKDNDSNHRPKYSYHFFFKYMVLIITDNKTIRGCFVVSVNGVLFSISLYNEILNDYNEILYVVLIQLISSSFSQTPNPFSNFRKS